MLTPQTGPGPLVRVARALGAGLIDAMIPRRCGLCGRFDAFLCPACASALPRATGPRCPTCWGTLDARGGCRDCAAVLVPALAGVRSPFQLEEGARRLVHAVKYDGLSALAEPMGALMAETLDEWGIRPDAIVPVPLHSSRERRRGFNQAALLGRACARAAGVPLRGDALRRTRRTTPQVRAASAEARQENVAGAFSAGEGVAGRTLLLVDDVCTTGATLRACAESLRRAGAVRVHGLTFARES